MFEQSSSLFKPGLWCYSSGSLHVAFSKGETAWHWHPSPPPHLQSSFTKEDGAQAPVNAIFIMVKQRRRTMRIVAVLRNAVLGSQNAEVSSGSSCLLPSLEAPFEG